MTRTLPRWISVALIALAGALLGALAFGAQPAHAQGPGRADAWERRAPARPRSIEQTLGAASSSSAPFPQAGTRSARLQPSPSQWGAIAISRPSERMMEAHHGR